MLTPRICGVLSCILPFGTGAFLIFFGNSTAASEVYTLSLHDALPILAPGIHRIGFLLFIVMREVARWLRSEEHTSELQSRPHLVCRLLLEKKKHIFTHFLSLYHLTLVFPPR